MFQAVILGDESIRALFKATVADCCPLCNDKVRTKVYDMVVLKCLNGFSNAASNKYKENIMKQHSAARDKLKFHQWLKGEDSDPSPKGAAPPSV